MPDSDKSDIYQQPIISGYELIADSNRANPKVITFRLAADKPMLDDYFSSVVFAPPSADRVALRKKTPTDYIGYKACSLALALFSHIGILNRLDLTDGDEGSLMTLSLLDTAFNKDIIWDTQSIEILDKILNDIVAARQGAIDNSALYYYGNPEAPLDTSHSVTNYFTSLWDTKAAPIIALHGGRMDPTQITYSPNKDGMGRTTSFSIILELTSMGACGGCSQKNDTLERVQPVIQAKLDELNTQGQSNPHYIPVYLDVANITVREIKTGLRVALRP